MWVHNFHPCMVNILIGRDPEYKRLGTVSLLAGINLHNGKIYPLVREQHRSREFIEFLKYVK